MKCVYLSRVMKSGASQQPARSAGHEETESTCEYHPVTRADFVSIEVLLVVKLLRCIKLVVIMTRDVSATKKLGRCL